MSSPWAVFGRDKRTLKVYPRNVSFKLRISQARLMYLFKQGNDLPGMVGYHGRKKSRDTFCEKIFRHMPCIRYRQRCTVEVHTAKAIHLYVGKARTNVRTTWRGATQLLDRHNAVAINLQFKRFAGKAMDNLNLFDGHKSWLQPPEWHPPKIFEMSINNLQSTDVSPRQMACYHFPFLL